DCWLTLHKSELRNTIAGILKSAKLPHSNITKQETKAVKSLKQDNSITILPADKGRTTVIMDTDTYEQQLTNMLQDRNTNEVLKKDPTEQKKRILKTLLKPLLETNKITQEQLAQELNNITRLKKDRTLKKCTNLTGLGIPTLQPLVDSILQLHE
uniref:Uncharacterized protein n=1 Tax=Amphiprion percula TaxID=161767 RepID=A0A3P8RXA2_AMPPE